MITQSSFGHCSFESGLCNGSSTSISLGNSQGDHKSQTQLPLQMSEVFGQAKKLSVMFDVWNSTFRLANMQLFANTPDTAVSLIRSSTFVRLIGVSVSESTNHLCGRSSLTSCSSNDPPAPITRPTQDPSKTIKSHFQETAHIGYGSSSEPVANCQVWIMTCAFSDITTSTGGSAPSISLFRADVFVTDSSFKQCHTTGSSGGSIRLHDKLFVSSSFGDFSATLFNCQFANNTAPEGGHLFVQNFHSLTIAQCTFKDSRSTSDTPLKQENSIHINVNGDCRFDNSTLSNNEGSETGGIRFYQSHTTGTIILTAILFVDNVCTHKTVAQQVTDCAFYNSTAFNNSLFDCFSTSPQPHCGDKNANPVLPDWIGPSITAITQTKRVNGDGNGFEIVLLFQGVFTGTSRKYDVTLEDPDGSEFVAENLSFSKTAGTATSALSNPSTSYLSPSTTYSIVKVERSASQAASNELVFEGDTEPDWTWWHHTSESRAGEMVGMSFTTPAGAALTNIRAELNASNLNEAIVILTVDDILAGLFDLIVFDSLDPLKKEITIGPFSFTSSSTPTTTSHTVLIHPSGELSYGKTYKVKTLSSPTLIVSHSAPSFSVPPKPRFSLLHISSAGSDENEGTEHDPLLTLHATLGRCNTEQNEDWRVEIADWCRIGKQTELGLEQEGLSVVVKGGEGRKIDCTLTDSEQTGEQGDSKEQGMVSVSKNTLSFVDMMFVVTSSRERIGSVFVVGEGGVVWMERCEVMSSETITHRFMTVSKDGEMKGDELQISSMRFGGKGSVISVKEKGRLALSSCSFDGVSFESGGVVVGKTRGQISIASTEFKRCSGRSFGSVIRLVTAGGEVIVTKCEFDSCSTTVALDEQGRRELGGGCVLVEMEEKGRSVSSCRVDLRESSFLGCTLSWRGKRQEDTNMIGGSGHSNSASHHIRRPLPLIEAPLLHPPYSALRPSRHLSSSVVPPSSLPDSLSTLHRPPNTLPTALYHRLSPRHRLTLSLRCFQCFCSNVIVSRHFGNVNLTIQFSKLSTLIQSSHFTPLFPVRLPTTVSFDPA
ncbi:hypothetical protein BLNAU_21885 [Blattamonas nauphoetae]|uniref:Right handed beta helix domain-containing protein n=1 Tax=Blattamonas nauphoetae TaxID=2049346 RepID=A0ABQ9WUP3_9EUKA|nr:hypothetical protein BLNAU_21885 [Blattamonas nauphoetae]